MSLRLSGELIYLKHTGEKPRNLVTRQVIAPRHNAEVGPVEEQLSKELQRLTPGDVILRVEQLGVHLEDLVVVSLEELGAESLVLRQQLLRYQEGMP